MPDAKAAPKGKDSGGGKDIPNEALRSALEFAVAIAAAGTKLRPPLAVPSGVKPFLRTRVLPTSALGKLRSAIENDADFLRRLGVVATDELIDEVGMIWLKRPADWRTAIAVAIRKAEPEVDEAGALRKEQRRRHAAETVAARSRLEAATLGEQLANEKTARKATVAEVTRLKAELAAARTQVRRLERAASKPTKPAQPAQSGEPGTAEVPPPIPTEAGKGQQRQRRPIAVPGGVFGDSEAAAEHLLRAPGVLVLVDGYNVAKLGWKAWSLERQRAACIEAAENIARRWGTSIHIVFDGASVVGASAPRRRLVRVSYSPAGVLADDVLRAEVAALDVARAVVVVTNDQAVITDVRAAGANVVSSDRFIAVARR